MRDRREEILERLTEIAGCLVGGSAVFRNREEIPEAPRPAILINDGDESVEEPEGPPRRRRNDVVSMIPDITIFAQGATSVDLAKARADLRRRLVAAVLSDSDLNEITGANGDVRYTGCGTRDVMGRNMMGQAGVAFTFTYPLLLSEVEL
ncbi:hypothetical protein [Methylocystis parvus]|uniref:hypothetical protein n=1 Tax=Methylocystis parvus TaxID=134 RepID=UPI003C7099EF